MKKKELSQTHGSLIGWLVIKGFAPIKCTPTPHVGYSYRKNIIPLLTLYD